ncbi:MAG: peptidoglycan DD-metalloendopeptidase family protein [Deltaproteobacteria bacterium]|jgi:septal ring factor EnvC (AmiA/AmiB activator)|nr:peptidoglycan DD-metalloendopeptidase family protein [Deltaproteobacteria bacterium]MDH4007898.1 peptidoglycan DD-metalloendopeptidase family protein [Desulfuromonadales bacterium]
MLSCLLLVLLILPLSETYAADELDASRERLDKLQKQIRTTLEGLRNKQSESGALSDDLERLNAEVRRIERLERKSQQQLTELKAQLKAKRRALEEIDALGELTEQKIRGRLVVLYKTGEVGLIRALLTDSESPRDIAEKYAFLSRMVRHDRDLLNQYRVQMQEHRKALEDLELMEKKQSAVVFRRSREQETLQKARRSKKILLAEVKQDAASLEKMLQELRAKAARLNELVKKLETEGVQPYTGNLAGLPAQKGRLLWPVPGKLRVGFGTSRHGELGTLIESHGFDIEAAAGTPVNAAASGKVIFANSLRGYGNLIIVDHGSKYYTLYAHMARFTKQVGDPVAAAEVIAYSGYEGRDAVYFEIRQGGKPLDPGDWLKPR